MTQKFCKKCNTTKNIEHFGVNKSKKDGRQSNCLECRNKYMKKWYSEHPELQLHRVQGAREQVLLDNRKKILEYYSSHPCVDCGDDRPAVLEFDHVRGKKRYNVSKMMTYSWKTILVEIAKCEVRCANCHRIKTAERAGWYKNI